MTKLEAAGLALARSIIARVTTETLSTHVEVSFEPYHAALILGLAERLVEQHDDNLAQTEA